MMISGRERLIILVAAVLVAALMLDRYVLTPLDDYRNTLDASRQRLLGDLERAAGLLAHKRDLAPKWKEITAGGLRHDPAEAESQVLHAVRDWSREAGLSLTSLKPERLPDKKTLHEITFQAACTGSMSGVARFLWRLETAKIPIRIRELQLGARREGADDLTLQLRLSTLYQPAAPPAAGQPAPPADVTGEEE